MTGNTHCKIGRIKPKSGGELRLLPDVRAQEGERLMRDLQWYVQHLKEAFGPDEFVGFAIVAWDRDCNQNIYHAIGAGSPIVDTTLATFVGDAFRRRIAREDAHTAIDERLVQ